MQHSSDPDLLQKLVAAIEQDVETFSVSGRQTTISHSTLYGLNSVSGKALVSLGNLILVGLEKARIRRALSKVTAQIEAGRVSTVSIRQVLELQR